MAHCKPPLYVASLLAAETLFQDCRCDGQRQHQPLEARNVFGLRTLQASVCSDTLKAMVIQATILCRAFCCQQHQRYVSCGSTACRATTSITSTKASTQNWTNCPTCWGVPCTIDRANLQCLSFLFYLLLGMAK